MLTQEQIKEIVLEMPSGMSFNIHYDNSAQIIYTFSIFDHNGITQEIVVRDEQLLLNNDYIRNTIYLLIKRIPKQHYALVDIEPEKMKFLESIYG